MLASSAVDRLELASEGPVLGDEKVAVFTNDVTPESVDRIAEGKIVAETTHGFADWGWFGTEFAVMAAWGRMFRRPLTSGRASLTSKMLGCSIPSRPCRRSTGRRSRPTASNGQVSGWQQGSLTTVPPASVRIAPPRDKEGGAMRFQDKWWS